MSDFAATWLALRARADAAARAERLTAGLRRRLGGRPGLRVIDLGSGSGNNARFLAPRLGRPSEWLLVDRDAALLEQAALPSAERLAYDLGQGFGGLPLEQADLVTGSALLDLVSARWLQALVEACAVTPALLLFTLTVDNRCAWTPADPDDGAIFAAFRAHQRRDKGFGPALGPAALPVLRRALLRAGYRVQEAPSDWRLGAEQADLQAAYAAGKAEAAAAAQPELAEQATAWLARRRALIEHGESRLVVGHRDLLAWPSTN